MKEETEIWVVYIDDGDLSNPPKPIAHFQTEELAEKWVEMIPPFCAHVNFSVSPAIVANKVFIVEYDLDIHSYERNCFVRTKQKLIQARTAREAKENFLKEYSDLNIVAIFEKVDEGEWKP